MPESDAPPPNDALDWAALIPEINKIARAVGRRKNASYLVRDELGALAQSFVYKQSGYYDPSKASFGAWCRTVLGNKCVDLIRKEATRTGAIGELVDRANDAVHDANLPVDEIEIPEVDWFDLYQRKLRAIDRILMSLDLEQCSRCPEGTMASWLQEANLPGEFPVVELEKVQQRDRNRAIAEALLRVAGSELTPKAVKTKMDSIRTRLFRAKVIIQNHLQGGD